MNARIPMLLAVLIVVGVAASLLARPIQPFDGPIMDALAETDATVENWPVQNLELITPESLPVTWANQYRGRTVYLTFWAEWCGICKSEMPSLSSFAAASQGRYDVVSVNIDSDPTAALAYLQQTFPEGVGFQVLLDPGGAQAQRFRTTGVPETFLIGPAGTVLARWVGARDFTQPVQQRLAMLVGRTAL